MRPTRELARLRRDVAAYLGRLREQAANVLADNSPHSRRVFSHVTIELLNTWAAFSRSFYLSCVIRPRRMRGGRIVATAFTGAGFNDAIGVAMARHRPSRPPLPGGGWNRRDEPTWHDIAVLLTSCTDLGCSNLTQIQAALSTGTGVFNNLPPFRNFFAHRNSATAQSARNAASSYTVPTAGRHPADILRQRPHGRPFPILLEWIDDVDVTVELMCE